MLERRAILDPGAYSFRMFDSRSRDLYEIRSCIYKNGSETIYGLQALQAYWEKGKSRILYPFEQGKMLMDARGLFHVLSAPSTLFKRLLKPKARVILPQDVLEEEKGGWISLCAQAGFGKVDFVSTMDLYAMENGMVIHAGHSCTEIGVYYHGRQIAWRKLMFAGQQMDEKIMDLIAGQYKALVFNEDASELRRRSCEAFLQGRNPRMVCTVLDYTSQYVRLELPAASLWPAMESVMTQIVLWAKELVASHGPEVMETVLQSPLLLSGGLANTYGFARMLEAQLDCQVQISEDPVHELLDRALQYTPKKKLKSAQI